MPTPVTVFRWDDAGAPQLNTGKPSEIFNVLKKCLVEGYGSKVPLDWSIAFENTVTQKIVFQNKVAAGGSGGMVRFRSNNSTDGNYSAIRLLGAKSFADIDSPFQPGFEQAFAQQVSQQKGWVLIGTPKSFYFLICRVPALTSTGSKMTSGANYNVALFCGDFESFVPSDSGRFIATVNATQDSTATSWPDSLDYLAQYGQSGSSNNATLKVMRADGGTDSMNHTLVVPFGRATAASNVELLPKLLAPVCLVVAGQSLGSQLSDTNGAAINESLLFPYYRGKLPGLYQGDVAGYTNTNWPVIKTIDARQMWLLKSAYTESCSIWIDMETWD